MAVQNTSVSFVPAQSCIFKKLKNDETKIYVYDQNYQIGFSWTPCIIRTLPSGFVVKRQKIDAVAWEVFILPFHPKLWLFLILLCGCTSLVLYIMHRYPKASYLNFFQVSTLSCCSLYILQ